MDKPAIPEDLRRFVLTSIPSVPFLEALLLLHADPDCRWDRDALAGRLYVRERTAGVLLADLCAAGLAQPCGEAGATEPVCYRPVRPELVSRVDRLADLYATHLVEVTLLIHSSIERQAQQFADAFKWRKDY
jgi:hypothetical protein